MVQHINLLSKRKVAKGLMTLAMAALGLWVLVLALFAVSAEWQIHQQRKLEAQARQSVSDLQAALEKKRQEVGMANSEAMTRQIALLRGQLDAKREWVDLLQKGELGNPLGYSQWFETVASVHVEGVVVAGHGHWQGGQTVSVRGKALNADAVMRYIEQANEAFKPLNVRFTSMEITQDATGDASSGRQTATLSFKIF